MGLQTMVEALIRKVFGSIFYLLYLLLITRSTQAFGSMVQSNAIKRLDPGMDQSIHFGKYY